MNVRCFSRACAVLLSLIFGGAQAVDKPSTPTSVVDAFHRALKIADGRGALEFMASNASVFEQGYTETSRKEYSKSQIEDASRFAKQTDRRVMSRESGQDGVIAWVMTKTLTTGEFEGSKLALDGAETMLLRREQDDWKIIHIHWSAHPSETAGEPPAPAAP